MEGLIYGYNAAVENIRGMVTQVRLLLKMTATVTNHIASRRANVVWNIEQEARQISVVADTVNRMAEGQ